MKLLSTAVAICLVLSYSAITAEGVQCTDQDRLLYEADLDTLSDNRIIDEKITSNTKLQGFSVEELKFSKRSQSAKAPCDWEGLIKITLPPGSPATGALPPGLPATGALPPGLPAIGALPPGLPAIGGAQDRALRFEFTHVQSLNDLGSPSFHIQFGDSIDDDAVDASTSSTTHSVEIFNDGRTLKLHINGEPYKEVPNFIDQKYDTNIIVGHQLQFVKAYSGDRQLETSLDGSQPSRGVADDNTVYVGLNRLIQETDQSPSGEGLCKVKVYAFTCN